MDKLRAFVMYFKENWIWLAPTIVVVLSSIITGLTNFPKVKGVLQVLLNIVERLSVTTHSDAPGTFKMLLMKGKRPGATASGTMGKVAALLPFIVFFSAFSGCYCWEPAHAQEPKCVVLRQVVSCSQDSIKTLAIGAIANLAAMVTSANPDWKAFGEKAEALGFRDGGCLLASLEDYLLGGGKVSVAPPAPGDTDRVIHVHAALVALKAKNNAPDVRFCVTAERCL